MWRSGARQRAVPAMGSRGGATCSRACSAVRASQVAPDPSRGASQLSSQLSSVDESILIFPPRGPSQPNSQSPSVDESFLLSPLRGVEAPWPRCTELALAYAMAVEGTVPKWWSALPSSRRPWARQACSSECGEPLPPEASELAVSCLAAIQGPRWLCAVVTSSSPSSRSSYAAREDRRPAMQTPAHPQRGFKAAEG